MGSIVGLLRFFTSAGEEVSSEDSSEQLIEQEVFLRSGYGTALLPKGKGKGKGQGKGKQPLCEGTWCSGTGLQDDIDEMICAICLR